MVNKSKTQFLKNDYFNTVKIISVENQLNNKTMPSTALNHGPSTTSCIWQSVLGRPCAGLWAIHRRCNDSPPHKSRDIMVRLGLRTSHRRCDIMHLVASKTPYSAYVSQDVSKNGHLTQIKFSRKTCQIGKIRFQNYFYKNLDLFIKYLK